MSVEGGIALLSSSSPPPSLPLPPSLSLFDEVPVGRSGGAAVTVFVAVVMSPPTIAPSPLGPLLTVVVRVVSP